MNEWLKNLAVFLLFSNLLVQMLPKEKYEPYARVFVGFLLLILLLQPLLRIRRTDTFLENQIEDFLREQEKIELEMSSFQEEESKEIYIEEIQQVQVEVTLND